MPHPRGLPPTRACTPSASSTRRATRPTSSTSCSPSTTRAQPLRCRSGHRRGQPVSGHRRQLRGRLRFVRSLRGAVLQAAVRQLAARGIATSVASGNQHFHDGIGFPACVSTAVSVGATDLDDDLADFGNRTSGLDLVAPGADEGNGTTDPMEIPDAVAPVGGHVVLGAARGGRVRPGLPAVPQGIGGPARQPAARQRRTGAGTWHVEVLPPVAPERRRLRAGGWPPLQGLRRCQRHPPLGRRRPRRRRSRRRDRPRPWLRHRLGLLRPRSTWGFDRRTYTLSGSWRPARRTAPRRASADPTTCSGTRRAGRGPPLGGAAEPYPAGVVR